MSHFDPLYEQALNRPLDEWSGEYNGQPLNLKQEKKKMAKYDIPENDFQPHPEGEHFGTITEVIDQGIKETRYGDKHKLTIIIESQTALKDDDEPFALWVWVTLSSGSKAKLVELRQKLLRRPLSDEERKSFDAEEMVGRKVRYMVTHNFGDNGQTYANLVTWTPAEQGQAAKQAREAVQQPKDPATVPASGGDDAPWAGEQLPPPDNAPPTEDDLPF